MIGWCALDYGHGKFIKEMAIQKSDEPYIISGLIGLAPITIFIPITISCVFILSFPFYLVVKKLMKGT
jgi:hypothetical protein